MARHGRNEMARHGRNEMARHGRNEMARHGRNEMSRFGRNEMSRYGRQEMARFGRQEMARFGRSEMARFGRSEMARFGRKEMVRHGRKERNDAEYDQRALEREAAVAQEVSADNGSEHLSKQVRRLEELLQEEQRKAALSESKYSALQQKFDDQQNQNLSSGLSKSPSLTSGKKSPLPQIERPPKLDEAELSRPSKEELAEIVKDYEAKLQRERERVRMLEEKLDNSRLSPIPIDRNPSPTKRESPKPLNAKTSPQTSAWGSAVARFGPTNNSVGEGKGRKIVLPQIK